MVVVSIPMQVLLDACYSESVLDETLVDQASFNVLRLSTGRYDRTVRPPIWTLVRDVGPS